MPASGFSGFSPPVRLLLLLLVTVAAGEQYRDTYDEEAFIKPLASGHINTFFQFTTEWNFGNTKNRKN